LRSQALDTGYPLRDPGLYELCTVNEILFLDEYKVRFLCFFAAVFDATHAKVQAQESASRTDFAAQWRSTMNQSGFREQLYRSALEGGRTMVSFFNALRLLQPMLKALIV